MADELTPEEVAILIQARMICNTKGLPRDIDVTGICGQAGISRKTGYQWAGKHEPATKETEDLRQELQRVQEEHAKLKQHLDDVNFENEGLKLAWKIHHVDELLAEKKTLGNRRKDGSGKVLSSGQAVLAGELPAASPEGEHPGRMERAVR